MVCFLFFFNDTATTEIYTLSLHDALPIYTGCLPVFSHSVWATVCPPRRKCFRKHLRILIRKRSEEHTSELQSHLNLVCRLLLEKKKDNPWFNPNSLTRVLLWPCLPLLDPL